MASVLQLILRTVKQGTGAKDTTKELGMLEKAAKSATVAFIAMGAAKVIKSSVMLAARVETLGVVTKKLGETIGMTEQDVRSLERAITDQGITLKSSRQSIAMMIQANVDLADATDLARLAQDTAVIAGLDSSEAFQQLTYVLQTGNVRMARTLGLNVQFGKAQQELAKSLGITTDALTEEEIMQARTNAVMEAGVRIAGTYEAAMGTAGKQMLSMPRQLEALSLAFGEMFLPVLTDVVAGTYAVVDGFNRMKQAQKDQTEEMTYGIFTYQEYFDEMTRLYGARGIYQDQILGLTEAEWNLARSVRAGSTEMDGWNTKILTAAQSAELFPELVVTATTEPAEIVLETFGEWLTRWSIENKRKVQLQATFDAAQSIYIPETAEDRIGGEARAMGGPVEAGKPYVVGEREAELFVPNQSGDIYNQQQLAGGDININNPLAQRAFNNMAEDWMRGLGG